jgi:hypothetical protein
MCSWSMNMVNVWVNDYVDGYVEDFFPDFPDKDICKNTEIHRRQFMIIQYFIFSDVWKKDGVYK